ncbi:uncharacterized protein B0P05DRAFT_624423 [Gilbertella persicaria]|uniref:uncharacterized protein n=1 Tax=Gilbertella persicaria TaxID=101096 RepID=UPI002220736F|nr:uncharacterized protein B0P05DRAFT_624423 [Gilbertella persicaria]KAI8060609.1 hypothetical protein B0P05DRAFT_624423 [Gilbertella persicaria]
MVTRFPTISPPPAVAPVDIVAVFLESQFQGSDFSNRYVFVLLVQQRDAIDEQVRSFSPDISVGAASPLESYDRPEQDPSDSEIESSSDNGSDSTYRVDPTEYHDIQRAYLSEAAPPMNNDHISETNLQNFLLMYSENSTSTLQDAINFAVEGSDTLGQKLRIVQDDSLLENGTPNEKIASIDAIIVGPTNL